MIFNPQCYSIADCKNQPFIDSDEIKDMLRCATPTYEQVCEVVDVALSGTRLSLQQTALLLASNDEQSLQIIMNAAKELKRKIYGDRIVIFAPLYIGNRCINNCKYCGFRASNADAVRRTLTKDEISQEVVELERVGQKRLILVYGEHPNYNAEYIADTVRQVYGVAHGAGKINRVNINAAPFDVDDFRTIKGAGIGTYQIFQETYDPEVYSRFHPSGRKRDYNYRLTAMDRAMEAGIDDVGLGVLFGLGDWRFEVMALLRHTNHLEACYGVGPHTISFPRIQNASNLERDALQPVGDADFMKLVAILRLAVPYTGLILTARESTALRNKLIEYGVSQIDAGTQLEIGGYSDKEQDQDLNREQFELMDTRSLAQTIDELIDQGQIPSFCTACYRKGRTGEHFMQFSTTGFIKKFCTPNALITFAEYLEDYASPELRSKGWALIEEKLSKQDDQSLRERLLLTKKGERDVLL